MTGISDYLESGVINFLFRGNTNSFARPGNLAIALCSGVPQDHQTGATILVTLLFANTLAQLKHGVTVRYAVNTSVDCN